MLVEGAEQGGMRRFPGRIDAVNKAELSFRVPGKVSELLVAEGDPVEKDQVLVKLDPTDFQLVVNDRTATFNRTSKDYKRAAQLVKEGNISRRDFDKIEADFKSAEASLQQARQDLSYTELQAPFKGTVSKRMIESFEEVDAKQPVLSLRDNSLLKVQFDVPENIVRTITPGDAQARDVVPVRASFETLPGREFELEFLEVATQADSQTQTFEVTFTMDAPSEVSILPGMTANVVADFSKYTGTDAIYYIPVAGIAADAELKPRVWVVDEGTMSVKSRPVEIGKMRGAEIEVKEGIKPGERVVTAGTPYLAEGMKVKLMEPREEAQPRPGDLPFMLKQ
ncbi:MAG: efflux RND transporter periplasmic adaptor subunit [Gammaproteobacteria bacterium]|nr:efflux RND transporter periplasmic adaptor subunit [Gammaproteobacteria bacterium]